MRKWIQFIKGFHLSIFCISFCFHFCINYIILSMIRYFLICFLCLTYIQPRWTEQQATKWYSNYTWSAGFNYAPSYAVNQIEMWQQYNQLVIDRELNWANQIGFSKLRVFLHITPFIVNQDLFIERINNFIQIAKKYNHHMIPVLFDDCWKANYKSGKQPDPIPGVHNSQWVQCPGNISYPQATLQNYVTVILNKFRNDKTIVMWDLYNEVGNSNYLEKSLPLLRKIFGWARNVNPSQPLTSGFWNGQMSFNNINNYILSESDVITFHAYCDHDCTLGTILKMQIFNRPVICTEYMARPTGSKFITHLPLFKEKNIWAINWGFVFGRTQTYYPWWSKQGDPVPAVWFHDVVHLNGTSYDKNETDFIRQITRTSIESQ